MMKSTGELKEEFGVMNILLIHIKSHFFVTLVLPKNF